MTADSGRGVDAARGAAAEDGRIAGSPLREIARSGVLAVFLHPLGSAITVLCLVAMLAPFLVGLGISRGAAEAAALSVESGADIYVSGERFGRPAPLPADIAAVLRAVPGVTGVEARIVGATSLGMERVPVVVVGVADDRLLGDATGDASGVKAGVTIVDGRLPAPGARAEVAIGSDLAARLNLAPGALIPPFYRNESGERATLVTGVFRSDLPAWQAHVMLAPYAVAQSFFDETDATTGFLLRCDAVYRDAARTAILRLPPVPHSAAGDGRSVRIRVVTKDDLAVLLQRRTHGREGDLALLYALAFSVGVPLVLASAGLGLSERRRETALLRALGWRTDEVVLRSLCESLVLATLGAALAVLCAWVWVRAFGAAGIARAFLPDGGMVPGFDVPFQLLPETLIAACVVSVVVTSAGTLWSAWRTSSAPPTDVLR